MLPLVTAHTDRRGRYDAAADYPLQSAKLNRRGSGLTHRTNSISLGRQALVKNGSSGL
jgi:hypothetical protein